MDGSLWLSLSVSIPFPSTGRGNQPQTQQARDMRSHCEGSFWEPLLLGRGNSSQGAQFTALKDADEGTRAALGPLQQRDPLSLQLFLGKTCLKADCTPQHLSLGGLKCLETLAQARMVEMPMSIVPGPHVQLRVQRHPEKSPHVWKWGR